LTTTPLPLWQVERDEISTTVATNLLGTIYGTQVAIRGMKGQPSGGHIFNVEGLGSKGETQVGLTTYGCTKAAVNYLDKALLKELKGSNVKLSSVRPGINVTEHLLHGAHVLSDERWAKTVKIMNILGDKPETTTPFLADKILAADKTGTRIAWLTTGKIARRFATAGFRKRDLFGELAVRSSREPGA
jgi:NAD(P)-dependent dehydrogenase (short-subunit alcohol dehydrogenase family)